MPQLVRFLIRHAVIGIGVAALFVGTLLLLDVARLGTLVWESPSGFVAVAALTAALGVTFGSVQMGFAVMLLGQEADGPGGGTPRTVLRPVPVRVASRAGRHTPRHDHRFQDMGRPFDWD
ncbi:hypothetical protein NVS89_03080 [Ancylobacter sp. MQZ15Z-1]|uniref:Uncharacterized protein n=1 Tax=Ancylobacter mangrovi TaxID=2972472 RepID=A0A9X2P8M5_9HYPH|nr:hypothetical protein [Ancylobacter mangrovi]MCS0494066.1 hypothetical protein [Ancylobacter mangrovi]